MAEHPYDFAIFGSTPLAGLIAGLLASVHRKRVVLIGQPGSRFRLPSGLDLSVMPATRPETWALLKAGTAETLTLLRRIGARGCVERLDAGFVGETPAGIDALSHLRHVALGFGFAVEPLPPRPGGGAGFRLRDIALLRRGRLEPALAAWQQKFGVVRLAETATVATVRRDETVSLVADGVTTEAGRAVLADDAAILARLPADRLGPLVLQRTSAMLTEPVQRLSVPLLIHVERGVTLRQSRGGGIYAMAPGSAERAAARVGGCLVGHGPVRRLGQSVFDAVAASDGAPLVGPMDGTEAIVLAGFGLSGAFFAPALARLLAGAAAPPELSYFSAREAGRGEARARVGDYTDGVVTSEATA